MGGRPTWVWTALEPHRSSGQASFPLQPPEGERRGAAVCNGCKTPNFPKAVTRNQEPSVIEENREQEAAEMAQILGLEYPPPTHTHTHKTN